MERLRNNWKKLVLGFIIPAVLVLVIWAFGYWNEVAIIIGKIRAAFPNVNIETVILSTISAIAMVALVFVTCRYARSTELIAEANEKMARETMQQRYGSVLPIIDIKEQDESAEDKIGIGLDIHYGQVPKKGSLCTLRNIGLGPAIDVRTFIIVPIDENPRQWIFGALSIGEGTDKERLSIEQGNNRSVLVAYYRDAYDRPFESSREFIPIQSGPSYKLGPLKIRELADQEYRKIFTVK